MDRLRPLLTVIEEIARGVYTDRIQAYTGDDQPEELRRLAEAIGMMMVKIEAREEHSRQLIEQLQQANCALQCATLDTVVAIAGALNARDTYSAGHGSRVAQYAERLARRLGLPPAEIEELRLAGLLHDIGKIGFSDRVFSNEDATISPSLREEIARHPDIAMDILGHLSCLGRVLEYIHLHHERLDGSGYPHRKRDTEIPRGARIIAVADCFDAITTSRPYQQRQSPAQAFAILRRIAGTHLDADLVELLIADIGEFGLADAVLPASAPA